MKNKKLDILLGNYTVLCKSDINRKKTIISAIVRCLSMDDRKEEKEIVTNLGVCEFDGNEIIPYCRVKKIYDYLQKKETIGSILERISKEMETFDMHNEIMSKLLSPIIIQEFILTTEIREYSKDTIIISIFYADPMAIKDISLEYKDDDNRNLSILVEKEGVEKITDFHISLNRESLEDLTKYLDNTLALKVLLDI